MHTHVHVHNMTCACATCAACTCTCTCTCVCTLSPGGIHTPEAIKLVWSSHREILYDYGPVPADHAKTQS